MRVTDLDRDMDDVIPTGGLPDSTFLFERMTEVTLGALLPAPGLRVLDVASGFGQDSLELGRRGCQVVAVEPSARMTAFARQSRVAAKGAVNHHHPDWVRGWSDALPFASQSFDASFCKGALDHFDRPLFAIAEMARVTRPGGRVVLAIANFDSLSCRLARIKDDLRDTLLRRPARRGRRHYDVPADHFTRYDFALMREQAGGCLTQLSWVGVSLAWGFAPWTRLLERLPAPVATGLLRALDAIARRVPGLADVVVLTGSPKRPPE